MVASAPITLAYVTGRHRALVEQAIAEYHLPRPHYVIADVGATLYQIDIDDWRRWDEWDAHIAPDWSGLTQQDLAELLGPITTLRLQEPEKQNRHKVSYYFPLSDDREAIHDRIQIRLNQAGIAANLIWSVDEAIQVGLLDLLPANASKLHAIRFLMQRREFLSGHTLFAGDSGNDIDVLVSDIPSVLVANADANLRAQVTEAHPAALYIATGGCHGMNGNYSAGILEGAAFFWPDIAAWLRDQA
jgi:HAD superfamily hydrolase (TIGR01484 family)